MHPDHSTESAARAMHMIPACASDLCGQGRNPCPTPWTCGKYEQDSEPATYIHLRTEDGGETVERTVDEWEWIDSLIDKTWPFAKWLAAIVLAAIAAAAWIFD